MRLLPSCEDPSRLYDDHTRELVAPEEPELQMGMGYPVVWKAADMGCHAGLGLDITSNQGNDITSAPPSVAMRNASTAFLRRSLPTVR
jgi:hypothetical protein